MLLLFLYTLINGHKLCSILKIIYEIELQKGRQYRFALTLS